jgi:hypothetical protein
VIAAGVVIFASLFVLATRQLRFATLGLLAAFAASNVLTTGLAPRSEVTLSGTAALAATVILYLAARDGDFGEDPRWRVWPAVAISAIASTLAYRVFQTADADPYLQLSAFWLVAVGLGILITARGPVRAVLGALLMLAGTQEVLRFDPGAHLATTIGFAWLEVLLALIGAYLIEKQRALEETA